MKPNQAKASINLSLMLTLAIVSGALVGYGRSRSPSAGRLDSSTQSSDLQLEPFLRSSIPHTRVRSPLGAQMAWTAELPCQVERTQPVGDAWLLVGTREEFCVNISEVVVCFDVWALSSAGVPTRLDTVQFERFFEPPRSPIVYRIQALDHRRALLAVSDRRWTVRSPCAYPPMGSRDGDPTDSDHGPGAGLGSAVGNEHWWIYDVTVQAPPEDWSIADTLPSQVSQFHIRQVEPLAGGELLAVHSITRLRHDRAEPKKFGSRVDVLDRNGLGLWHTWRPNKWTLQQGLLQKPMPGAAAPGEPVIKKLSETSFEIVGIDGESKSRVELSAGSDGAWLVTAAR